MKNQKITVTAAELNTGLAVEKDPTLIITRNAQIGPDYMDEVYFPLQIRVENNSGVQIGFNVIDDVMEYGEYLAGATYYELLPVDPEGRLVSPETQKAYRLLTKKISGTAVGDVVVYCINYVRRGIL